MLVRNAVWFVGVVVGATLLVLGFGQFPNSHLQASEQKPAAVFDDSNLAEPAPIPIEHNDVKVRVTGTLDAGSPKSFDFLFLGKATSGLLFNITASGNITVTVGHDNTTAQFTSNAVPFGIIAVPKNKYSIGLELSSSNSKRKSSKFEIVITQISIDELTTADFQKKATLVDLQPTDPQSGSAPELFVEEGAELSSADLSSRVPDDIFSEISFFGGGGGGYGDCQTESSMHMRFPWVMNSDRLPNGVEWTEILNFQICDWVGDPPTELQLRETPTSGVVDTIPVLEATRYGSWSQLNVQYEPKIYTPPGDYYLYWEQGGEVHDGIWITINLPEQPRLYQQDSRLVLHAFQPNEKVRVFAYEGSYDASLVGWKEYQTDGSGSLRLTLTDTRLADNPDVKFVAIGETTGEVPQFYRNASFNASEAAPPTTIGSSIQIPGRLELSKPTKDGFEKLTKIWDLVEFKDITEPGTVTYKLRVNADERLGWGFTWCAKDENLLRDWARFGTAEFYVDGHWLGDRTYDLFYMEPKDKTDDWICDRKRVALSSLPPGEIVELEVRIDLSEEISDGVKTYLPGLYRHIVQVEVAK